MSEQSGSALGIVARDLVKTFEAGSSQVRAVDGISLVVPPGQFACLHGRSGSGKTTLLNLLAGLFRPTAGEVFLGDFRVDTMSTEKADLFRLERLGIVFESLNLLPTLSVVENVSVPLLLSGIPFRHAKSRVDALLMDLDLGGKADRFPSQLSRGEMQRVAIARALVHEPGLLLADEPTRSLDTRTAADVIRLLRELTRNLGATAIVMTQDADISQTADRLLELSDGRIVEDIPLG